MTKGTLTARTRLKLAKPVAAPEPAENETAEAAPPATAPPAPAPAAKPRAPRKTATARANATPPAAAPAAGAATASAPPANKSGGNLQDLFLNTLRREKIPVTMFLVKGVKLQGIVTWFDNFSILLRRDGQVQLVYKHAISTIMPSQPIDARPFGPGPDAARKQRQLQDIFLASVRESGVPVTMFLVNGVMLQGRIAAFDLFCTLLEREGFVQLAYKHAVSTIQPVGPVDLSGGLDGEEGEAP
ncbi:MAG: RNA chaperone Hfq [Porphyrobacter sp.]|nr:RNA chaperone Hfq [Porphyrobacter sp.]